MGETLSRNHAAQSFPGEFAPIYACCYAEHRQTKPRKGNPAGRRCAKLWTYKRRLNYRTAQMEGEDDALPYRSWAPAGRHRYDGSFLGDDRAFWFVRCSPGASSHRDAGRG